MLILIKPLNVENKLQYKAYDSVISIFIAFYNAIVNN